jgi:calcineurin-like phosphoesterase
MTIRYLEGSLPRLRRELGVDFVVANGENADLTDPALGKAGMHWETVDRLVSRSAH